MEKDVTVSARVSSELAAQVDVLSKEYNRSRSWLVQEALKHYVLGEMEFIAAVQEGKDAVARGDVVEHEEVVAEWERYKRQLRCD